MDIAAYEKHLINIIIIKVHVVFLFFYNNTAILGSLELFLILPTLKPKNVLNIFLKLQNEYTGVSCL